MTGQRRWQGYVGSGLVSALGLLGMIGIYVSMRHVASLSANLSELQRLLQATQTSLVRAAASVAKPDTDWRQAGQTPPPASVCADADRLSRDLQAQLGAFRSSLRDEFSAWAEALMPRAGEGDGPDEPTDEPAEAADPEARVRARQAVEGLIEDALARSAWTEADRDGLRRALHALSPHESKTYLLELSDAVNQGRIDLQTDGPLF